MKSVSLARILECAVGHALLSGVAACGGESAGGGAQPLSPAFSFAAPAETTAGSDTESSDTGSADPDAMRLNVRALACFPAGESRLAHAELGGGHAYVALRASDVHGVGLDGAPQSPVELDARGRPCEGASDLGACEAALASAWPTEESAWIECGQAGCVAHALVTTRGDEIRVHESASSIRSVLGAIDAPVEALLWADASGYEPLCDGDPWLEIPPLELYELPGGYRLVNYELTSTCPITYEGVRLDIAHDGRLQEVERFQAPPSSVSVCVGRRPPGLELAAGGSEQGCAAPACAEGIAFDVTAAGGSASGELFGRVAGLEAAAATAFDVMASELEALGAPAELVAACRAAAGDEVRHAAITARLARSFGAAPRAPQIEARALRGLLELALDNVVEGCVRETFGAAVSLHQALASADAGVRAALNGVASDERRHAELSLRAHAWARSLLAPAQVEQLARAARAAIDELRAEQRVEPGSELQRVAGLPSAAAAVRLLDVLEAELWCGGPEPLCAAA